MPRGRRRAAPRRVPQGDPLTHAARVFGAAPHAVAIFAAALALRLWHVWQLRGTPFLSVLMGDARGYDSWARRLAAGDWIGADVFYQAPLYPYFLGAVYALFGRDLLIVRIVQAILGSASCVLVGYTAARLFGSRAGVAAGLVMALYAPAIFFDALLQKSVLDVFFVSAVLALLAYLSSDDGRHPRRAWIALGLAAGGLVLTRENALVLPAVLGTWAWLGGPRGRVPRATSVALLAAGMAIVVLPVAARNYAVSGGLYLTTSQFGPNFYIGNHSGADGTYTSLTFGRGSPEYERVDAEAIAERAAGRPLTPSEVSGFWTRRAMAFIQARPGEWLRLELRKIALLVNGTEMLDTESQASHAEWSTPLRVLGPVMHFGVLVPLSAAGIWITRRDRRRLWVFYVVGVTYALSTVVFYVFARYRYPLVPMLVPFAAAALAGARDLARARATRELVWAGAIASAAAVAAGWPLLSTDLMRAITETNLGSALFEAGRTSDAEARYRRAIAIRAGYAPAYNNLGVALRSQGRDDEAVRTYREGLRYQHDYPDLHYNLGNVLAAQGRFAEAEPEFRTAAALEPGSPRPLQNLGTVLAQRGRIDEAAAVLRQAMAIDPADADAPYELGSIYLEAGRFGDAVAAFELALRRRPGHAEARNNLGIALGSQGRLEAAIAQFEEALRINPGFVEAQQNLRAARAAGGQRR